MSEVHRHCRRSVRRQVDDERAITRVLCGCRRYRRRESDPEDSEQYRERPQRSYRNTVDYYVKIFDTLRCRNPLYDCSRQHKRFGVYVT